MNDEIIKINKLNKSITFINNGIVFSQFGVADEILDLITNLQEKNERLKELNICVGCENNPDYKLRCEKAINFINKTKGFIFNEWEEIITGEVVDADGVLDILEGKNNE